MSWASIGARIAAVGAILIHQSPVHASPHYLFGPFLGGDEVAAVDLNDLGTVVMTGNGRSYLVEAGGDPFTNRISVHGFRGGYDDGVEVLQINNAGDLFGSALTQAGAWVPTLWIDGMPFDLSDPMNVGMLFVPDPGPRSQLINLNLLEVIGQPFADSLNGEVCNYLTNTRGDLVAAYSSGGYTCGATYLVSYALLLKVPEPSSIALFGVALAAAGWAGRSVRRRS